MATEAQCSSWGREIRTQATEFYDHQIREAENLKQEAVDRGEDPNNVSVQGGIAYINYSQLIDNTLAAKAAALNEADRRENDCLNEAAPDWMTDPQKIVDYAMAVALLPYVALTNNYAAAKVDLNEVYKGRTFGGENAVIPKVRDQVFNALGISGDVKNILSDPVNTVSNTVQQIIKALTPPKIDIPIKIDWPRL